MQDLASASGLVVSQRKEWGEILSGFETKNRYAVQDLSGNLLYQAAEEDGSMLLRMFLKALRPFSMVILTESGQRVLRIDRPFRFYFHHVDVYDASGRLLGSIQRQFSLIRRIYSVSDAAGREAFELFGPILHPWTFQIKQDGRECGKITKKWSGLGKEMFSDADNFAVMFPAEWSVEVKVLFLGAVFLIDFVHFENKGKN